MRLTPKVRTEALIRALLLQQLDDEDEDEPTVVNQTDERIRLLVREDLTDQKP